jgi:hypothetical protein
MATTTQTQTQVQNQTGSQQRDQLFSQLQQPFPASLQAQVPKGSFASTLFNFKELYRRTFPNNNIIERSSTRYVHPYGSIAKVTWTPTAGDNYNGIYQTSLPGIIRLGYSANTIPLIYYENNIIGFGLKLFPNTPAPANTIPGKTGTLDTEFLEINFNNPLHDFDHVYKTNIEIPYIPNIFYYVGFHVGKEAFNLATDKEPVHLALSHFSTNGPKVLYADFVHKELVKIGNVSELKVGDVLFNFYDSDPKLNSSAKVIGTLTLDEPFIPRDPYADQFLVFDHNLNDKPRSTLLKWLPIRLGYYGYTAVKRSLGYILGSRSMLS